MTIAQEIFNRYKFEIEKCISEAKSHGKKINNAYKFDDNSILYVFVGEKVTKAFVHYPVEDGTPRTSKLF